jgi:hypothetical protein
MAEIATNPNDYKVVTFTNKTDFEFTPELGCMYDSRPIFGKSGASVKPGESVVLPFHVGNLLAKNLAKALMNRKAPADPQGIPTGVSLWDDQSLKRTQASFITEMYTEDKPAAMTETDRLMAKVDEYKALVEKLIPASELNKLDTPPAPGDENQNVPPVPPTGDENKTPAAYNDKSDVIAELEKRGVPHDKRKSKDDLEKLLV